jgi:2-(1,2-epoxy-1,2-dihydrophenyl)acetyl-CoA isomerase
VNTLNDTVITKSNNGIAIVYLNEPSSLNALTQTLKEQLQSTLDLLKKDDSIQVVIFKGNGKGFCAGGDIKAMANQEYNPLEMKKGMDASARIIETIRSLPKLTISAVHGFAAGAGMSLALASDIVIAEEGTKFILSFKNMGLIPDLGLHYYLPRIVGEWKAKEWIWKGKKITAEEAMKYGLVMEIAPKGMVLEQAVQFSEELIKGPIQAYIFSKIMINRTANVDLETVLARENDTQTILKGTEDHKQAVAAFFAKK